MWQILRIQKHSTFPLIACYFGDKQKRIKVKNLHLWYTRLEIKVSTSGLSNVLALQASQRGREHITSLPSSCHFLHDCLSLVWHTGERHPLNWQIRYRWGGGMKWAGAACRYAAEQTALRTDICTANKPALQQSSQTSNSPREDPFYSRKPLSPLKYVQRWQTHQLSKGWHSHRFLGLLVAFTSWPLWRLHLGNQQPGWSPDKRKKTEVGLVLLAVPIPKEVSRGFPYTIAGESHMDKAAGRAGLTLNCYYFFPLFQNTCWSLSILLPFALCNPNLHLLSTRCQHIPSYPLHTTMHMHKPLLPPPQISTSLCFYQSTSGFLITSSTEQHYTFSTQYFTSLFTLFFLFGLLYLGRKLALMDTVLIQSQKILVSWMPNSHDNISLLQKETIFNRNGAEWETIGTESSGAEKAMSWARQSGCSHDPCPAWWCCYSDMAMLHFRHVYAVLPHLCLYTACSTLLTALLTWHCCELISPAKSQDGQD